MKKATVILIVGLLVMMLALTACGKTSPAPETPQPSEETPQPSEAVQIANPWHDITEAEAAERFPESFVVPEGAENVHWSVMESGEAPALLQLSFDLNGNHFTAREQQTNDRTADISGMYYEWTVREESTLRDRAGGTQPCNTFRYVGENEYADLCTWYDEQAGLSHSLGVTAKDLEGFDLLAVADAMLPVSAQAAEIETEASPAASYESVIQAYKTAYETGNNNAMEYVFTNELSEFIVGSSHVGYVLWDLDEDGTPELILADPDAGADQPVFAIYTLNGEEPAALAVSYARNRYYMRSDGSVLNEGSGGASYTMVYLLRKIGNELVGVEGLITAPTEDFMGELFYQQSGSVSYEPRPEDQEIDDARFAAKWEEYKSSLAHLDLTPIA